MRPESSCAPAGTSTSYVRIEAVGEPGSGMPAGSVAILSPGFVAGAARPYASADTGPLTPATLIAAVQVRPVLTTEVNVRCVLNVPATLPLAIDARFRSLGWSGLPGSGVMIPGSWVST